MEIITADTAHKALEMLKKAKMDLMVTDLTVPGRNGYKLFQRLHQSTGGESLIVILFLLRTSVHIGHEEPDIREIHRKTGG